MWEGNEGVAISAAPLTLPELFCNKSLIKGLNALEIFRNFFYRTKGKIMQLHDKPKIWAAFAPFEPIRNYLDENADFDFNRSGDLADRQMIKDHLPGVQGLFVTLRDKIDAALITAAPDLKAIATMSVGFDHIDVEAATQRGIWVSNTPDVLTDATADLAWALLLATLRRIPEGDRLVRSGGYSGWRPDLLLGTELSGKTLGIWGAGRIGQAIARRALGFDLRIIYHSRVRKPEFERQMRARWVEWPELFRQSDFLFPAVSLNEETRDKIGPAEFHLMRRSAILVNIARGGLIQEEELIRILRLKLIAGAGLDVYVDTTGIHKKLGDLNHVVLTPHIGSATVETREKMAFMAAEDLISILKGQPPKYPVNEIQNSQWETDLERHRVRTA
jgi:glyoxylate reductase